MTTEDFDKYLKEADRRMKENNGHQFVTILKTRCQYCGKKPGIKTRCGGWFQSFVSQLTCVLLEGGVIK